MKANGFVLTKEERDVLVLAATHPNGQHLNNTEVAQRLGISISKAKILIHQACMKLGAHNRNEAILFAIRRGEIKLDELYTLNELAEMLNALNPDVLKKIAQLVREDMEYGHPPWKDEQITSNDKRKDVILTESEQDVLRLVGRGLTNREIADTLYISVNAVNTFLYRAYNKLGVHKRVDAVVLALKRGDIGISEILSLNELIQNLAPLGAETLDKLAQLLNQKHGQEPVMADS